MKTNRMNMQDKAILFILMCVFGSCGIYNNKIPHQYEGVKLRIVTPKSMISDSILINISLENNTKNDFYIFSRGLSISGENTWNLEINFQDTIGMGLPYMVHYGSPKINDERYVLIKSEHTYTSCIHLDFRELYSNRYALGQLNTDYGEYFLKLSYHDYARYHIKALKGKIESNVLKVVYEP